MLSSPLLSLLLHLSDKIPLCPMTRWLTFILKKKKQKKKTPKKHEPFFVDILHKFQRESIKNNKRAIRSTWGLNYWFCLQMSKKITTETKMFIFLSRLKLLSKINKQTIHQKTKKALITTITSIKIRKKKKCIGNPNKLTPQESPSIPEENIFNLEQLDISLQLTVHILKELCNKKNLLSVFLSHFIVLFVIAVMQRSSKESFY